MGKTSSPDVRCGRFTLDWWPLTLTAKCPGHLDRLDSVKSVGQTSRWIRRIISDMSMTLSMTWIWRYQSERAAIGLSFTSGNADGDAGRHAMRDADSASYAASATEKYDVEECAAN